MGVYRSKLAKNIFCSFIFYLCIGLLPPALNAATAVGIPDHNPTDDDHNNLLKKITASGSEDLALIAADLSTTFVPGVNPAGQPETLNNLNSANKVSDPNNILGLHTLTLGPSNMAITIPDPITGTPITMQVYDSTQFALSTNTIGEQTVTVLDNVNDQQYIGLTIAEVTDDGTQSISLGSSTEEKASSTNHLNLAAKQSTLFEVIDSGKGSPKLSWDSDNRVTFFGATITPPGKSTYTAQGIPTFGGTFTFTTLAGNSYTKAVTDDTSLKDYNDWLITELSAGRLQSSEYAALFAKAVTIRNDSVVYNQLATEPDEIFTPAGERIIIKASGSNASATITGFLEGANASAAVKLENGATATVAADATLGNTDGAVIALSETSSAVNNGVINANFLTDANGNRKSGGNQNVHSIQLTDATSFTNNGILNVNSNSGSGSAAGLYLTNTVAAAAGTGYFDGTDYYSAGNSATGTINVAVNTSSASGATAGVEIASAESSFINEGAIYLGRAAQHAGNTGTTDVAINQKGLLTGIRINDGGTAINAATGTITLGTMVQNAAGMFAGGGDATVMANKGLIELLNNKPLGVANTNYGILVQNAGKNGGIAHEGIINLHGVNGVGVKILSTGSGFASASTAANSLIDIDGAAELTSGTRNYGVWVEGQGSNIATATLDGKINLAGDGAIGIHARGKAEVAVSDTAIPTFVTGKKQIAFFAYGDGATINLTSGLSTFDVSTEKSTLFRIENGAELSYHSGLKLETSGVGSQGIVATGAGSVADLSGADFDLTGVKSIGVIIEGGATGNIVGNTTLSLDANESTGVVVNGQKHNLSDQVTGTYTTEATATTTVTGLGSQTTGFSVKNSGKLTTTSGNVITLTSGTDNTGISVASEGSSINQGAITVADGTGIKVADAGSLANNSGAVTVTTGTGIDITAAGAAQNTGAVAVTTGTGISVAGSGSSLLNRGSIVVDTGTGLDVFDQALAQSSANITVTDGIAGARLATGGRLELAAGANITAGGTAHGILMDTGAEQLIVRPNTTVTVTGTGNGLENTAETPNILLLGTTINAIDGAAIRTATPINFLSHATLNVTGSGTGFLFEQKNTQASASGLFLGAKYTFNITGAGATGIKAHTTGNVLTAATVLINNADGGSALIAGTAKQTINTGDLRSISTVAPVVDLSNSITGTTFENGGTIYAVDALHTAIQGSAMADALLLHGGAVRGDVHSGEGNDYLEFSGGTLDGSITMGDGVNKALIDSVDLATTQHITSGTSGSNILTLNNITTSGASLATDNLAKGVNFGSGWNSMILTKTYFTLTDNLSFASSQQQGLMHIDPSSILFAGNNVNAEIIPSGNPSSFTVLNQGVITLTDRAVPVNPRISRAVSGDPFSDTLTIGGSYKGDNGSLLLDTLLNKGGSLTDQRTDRLFIKGAASGTTFIDFNLTHLPSFVSGAGTDLNSNGAIESNEGISVVQVAGNASPDTFKLRNGYVASGAYQYHLYAFDHTQADVSQNLVSGAGNSFYDFRLANAFVASQDRLMLIPQVPAYLSLPTGMALYGAQVMDDMHKRLGELRYQRDWQETETRRGSKQADVRGFIRYIGSDLTYSSSVSSSDYGYDFDLEYQAMQLGVNLLDLTDANNDGLQVGIAWTHGWSKIKPDSADGDSDARTDSDTLGLYATYQYDKAFYLDAVVAGTRSETDVETDYYSNVNTLKSKGWSASLEAGYSFRPTESERFVIEPQAQLTYLHTTIKDSTDDEGTTVAYDNSNTVIARLGLRVAQELWTDDMETKITPYARLNYYKSFDDTPDVTISSVGVNDGATFSTGKFGDTVQGGLGVTIEGTRNIGFYGEATYQQGLDNYGLSGWGGTVGLKIAF